MKLDGITPQQISHSLNLESNIRSIFAAGEGAGQSGSFFFFSKDKQFLIKTMRGSERIKMMEMVDSMVEHLKDNKSLLARIYGMFTIKSNMFHSVDFLIMQNTVRVVDKNS